jgi:tyrosyl-tRNA synthetase
VARFHDQRAAERALADFEARFRQGEIPEDIPEFTVSTEGGKVLLGYVLKETSLTASTSAALRMIEQGGVRLDGDKVSDKNLSLSAGQTVVLQVGKRKFARVKLT